MCNDVCNCEDCHLDCDPDICLRNKSKDKYLDQENLIEELKKWALCYDIKRIEGPSDYADGYSDAQDKVLQLILLK
jgi:hypothetical protein